MFSLANFYYILYKNLLEPVEITPLYFSPFGSTSPTDLVYDPFDVAPGTYKRHKFINNICYFYDQEPLIPELVEIAGSTFEFMEVKFRPRILANTEHSDFKRQYCRENQFLDWYYFFHGFAALDWYRDYQYIPKVENKFSKVFISLNRLVNKDRSYRLNLVASMMQRGILDKGHVSLDLGDRALNNWQKELSYPDTKLSPKARYNIKKYLSKLDHSLVLDQTNPQGWLSAMCDSRDLYLQRSGFWHVVSETVFYYPKLHLTEKIFKPVVVRRPFILVAAPGNLAYLKSYGFKTFDKWIDESYDTIEDHDERISAVTAELEKLCRLSREDLDKMNEEMQEVLDYNFNHFYGEFKKIIVNELVDNYESALGQWNNGKFFLDVNSGQTGRIDVDSIKLDAVKQRLLGSLSY